MVCKKCGNEISVEAKLCPACMVRSEVSVVPFWVTMVVLLAWEMATSAWGKAQADGFAIESLTMAAAGFCLTVVLTATKVVDARKIGVLPCLSILIAYLLWYAFYAVSLFSFARSGAYESLRAVVPLCSTATLTPLWPWAAVIVAGLAKNGKIKLNGVTILLCGIAVCAVSAGGFIYIHLVPVSLTAPAGTYILTRLGGQLFLRFGMLCSAVAWGCGRVRGLWTDAVLFGAPVFAAGVMLLTEMGYSVEAVFYASFAVYAGFALVSMEFIAMSRGREKL